MSEGLYTSSLIRTNATITMAESRRIWLVTDDGKNASCSKVSLIGINKENLIKGDLTAEEKLIEKEIAQTLINDGVYIAGLDVIDGKIIEINITSPCFFYK